MGRLMLITSMALACIISSCGRQAVKGPARVEELKLPGDYLDFLLADFDGDSIQEILAFSLEEASQNAGSESAARRKGTVISYGNGGYSHGRVLSFDLPTGAVVFDTGDIDGDARPEILYLTGDGLYSIAVHNGVISKPLKVVSQSTIFVLPTPESAVCWRMYRISRSPRRPLILIPCIQGISIYAIEEGLVDSLTTIHSQPYASASSRAVSEMRETNPLAYSCSLPIISVADYESDGIDDIFLVRRSRILIYPGNLSRGFAEQPTVTFGKDMAPDDMTQDSNSELLFQVGDLNGDGRADIVMSRGGGGITHYQTEVSVYIGNSGGGYSARPSYVRRVAKSAGRAFLNDFNGDGRIDLAIPSMQLGVTALLKMLVLNRLDMEIGIFLQQVGGQFPNEPTLSKSISSSVDLGTGNIAYAENMAFSGDYNGDRLKDFLFENGTGKLQVFYGAPATVFSPDVGWSTVIPHPCCLHASDLDHDGRSEILAFYPRGSKDDNIIRVIKVGQETK